MRKTVFISVILICVFAFIVSAQLFRDSRKSEEHSKWIADSIREMETIEVGKTRAELLKVFTTEGGLSTGLDRTYVYRNCPFIKVRVEFEAVGRQAKDAEGRITLDEDSRDKIKTISKPYLEWSIVD